MSDLHSKRMVQSLRKSAHCYQCNRKMEHGERAVYVFGKYEGDVYSMYIHPECDDAAMAFATLNGMWGEEFPYFPEMENSEYDHHAWLLDNHPVVAERMNISCEAVQ